MDSPQNHIWGPHLWMILHSAAERIGSKSLNRLPQEEARIWYNLLRGLRYSLPCPMCKTHYTAYYASNNINTFDTFDKENIRNWLYNLHNQVNIRTNKPNSTSIEDISDIYSKPFNLTAHFNIFTEQMTKSLRLGWCSRDDIQHTVRHIQELKRFYDFF